jgi:integrase
MRAFTPLPFAAFPPFLPISLITLETRSTSESEAAVPVLPAIARVLVEHEERCKNPTPNSYIFAGDKFGGPLNLANLARRVIKASIEKCSQCGKCRAEHEKEGHTFELDTSLAWKGWHALRRGLASNLYSLGAQPRVIQFVLRHASISMTMQFYVHAENDAARTALKPLTDLFYPLG